MPVKKSVLIESLWAASDYLRGGMDASRLRGGQASGLARLPNVRAKSSSLNSVSNSPNCNRC